MSYQDILPLVFTEIIGDFGYEKFANKGGLINFFIGTSGYFGVIYFLIRALQGSNILLVNGVWDGLSTLIETLAAIIILQEYPKNINEMVGLILIIVGLMFVKLPIFRNKKFLFPKL